MTLANATNLPAPGTPPAAQGNLGGDYFVLLEVLSGKGCGVLTVRCG